MKFNNIEINFCTPWSGCQKHRWGEITKVTYNRSLQWYVFHTKDKRKMRFSENLTGINGLLKTLKRKNIPYSKNY